MESGGLLLPTSSLLLIIPGCGRQNLPVALCCLLYSTFIYLTFLYFYIFKEGKICVICKLCFHYKFLFVAHCHLLLVICMSVCSSITVKYPEHEIDSMGWLFNNTINH